MEPLHPESLRFRRSRSFEVRARVEGRTRRMGPGPAVLQGTVQEVDRCIPSIPREQGRENEQ